MLPGTLIDIRVPGSGDVDTEGELVARLLQREGREDGDGRLAMVSIERDPCRLQGSLQFAGLG